MPAFGAGVGWPPEPALPGHQAPAGREGKREGRIKAQGLFDPFLGKDGSDPAQMRSQTARLRGGRPTSQRGTLRWRVAAPAQKGPWQDGRGVSFVSLLAGAAAPGAKGNSHPDKRTADISCGAAPPTASSPGPADNRAPGAAAGRGDEPHLGRNANPFQEAAGDRRRPQGGGEPTESGPRLRAHGPRQGAHPPGVN